MSSDTIPPPAPPRTDAPAGLLRALVLALTRDEDEAVRQWGERLLAGDERPADVTCPT